MPKLASKTRQARRQELVDAGRRCLARGGYRYLTVDAVCQEAQVSKGAFYTYFVHKEDLLMALLGEDAESLDAVLTDLDAQHRSGVERLRSYLARIMERGQDPSVAQVRADFWAEVKDAPDLGRGYAAAVQRRRTRLVGWIDEAVAAGELRDLPRNALASVVLALEDGLLLHSSIDRHGFQWANVREAVERLLDGLLSQGSPETEMEEPPPR